MIAIFEYLISKSRENLAHNTLPNLNPNSMNKIFDNILSKEKILKSKFDSIVSILMKRLDVDRLYNLVYYACNDRYKFDLGSGEEATLNIDQK